MYSCPICAIEPSSHSFKIVNSKGNAYKTIYYTCPAECTNWGTDGIIAHYNGMLVENGYKPWYWIVDCKNFGLKHTLEVTTFKELAKLIMLHSDSLKRITIVNANIYIRFVLGIVRPFLSEHVQSIIRMKH